MSASIIRIRAAIGPLVVGLSTWCAAGAAVTSTWNPSGAPHFNPASWWVFPAATAIAAFIPALRRQPTLALPSLLSTLAWLPGPLSAVFLIWTGPLAFAPVAASLLASIGVRPLSSAARFIGAAGNRESMWLAAFATLLASAVVAWTVDPRLPEGDEPHYLAIAQSLLKDGDLRIENNHHDPDFVSAFGDLEPDWLQRGRDGAIYSIHAPGLAILVLPAFALFGYYGAQATVALLGAITGSLVWRIVWRATKDVRAAWFAWAAIVGSVTFLIQSVTVFPDVPGALCIAAGLLLYMRLGDQGGHGQAPPELTRLVMFGSMTLALLPWLHTRLALPAGIMGALIVWSLAADTGHAAAEKPTQFMRFLALPLMSLIGWFAFFQIIYGTPNPAAPYGDTSGPGGSHLRYIPGGLVALLFDQQFGLLVYAPVLLIGFVSFLKRGQSFRRIYGASLAITASYLAVATSYWMWWAGRPAPPARFTTAILPALAPGLADAWTRASAAARKALLGLLAFSLAITVVVFGVDRGALAWNDRDAHACLLDWVSPLVNLPRGWPSFFWKLDPQRLSSEIPFVVHAGVSLGMFVAGWFILRLRSREGQQPATNVLVALWLLVSVMAVTEIGWLLNGVSGYATGSIR